MKKTLLFILGIVFSLNVFAQPGQASIKKQLEAQKVENAVSQADIDKNLILQYAIDNSLNVQSTDSGIYYIMEKEGEGGHPDEQSMITAHYHGTLLNGTIFDSSVERGDPIVFPINRVVKGWQEAIPMLKKGGKGKFIIPSHLAYGGQAKGKIPANSVLVFDIELVDFTDPAAEQKAQAEADDKLIKEYLATNGIKAEMHESGIYYVIEKPGEGTDHPDGSTNITAHYHGTLLNGNIFDSSVERGEPLQFNLGRVIKGWQIGIPLLKKGGKGTLYIPSALAYGARGAGGVIPPNAVLIFEVELIDFEKQDKMAD